MSILQNDPGRDDGPSNWALIRRLMLLGWRYRGRSIVVLALQFILLAIGLCGLNLTGVGLDYIRAQVDASARLPAWPFGIHVPADAAPMTVIAVTAIGIFLLAGIRTVINYVYSVQLAYLVQRSMVVNMRSEVYAKLQRLSFRFFDENATGSIINRVTRDVQGVRQFIDQVVIQSVIMVMSLVIYVVYMLHIHVWLTIACLATTPVLLLLSSAFAAATGPAFMRCRVLVDNMVLSLSESMRGIPVVKAFAREDERIADFARANAAIREQRHWIFHRMATFRPLIGFVTQVNIVILLCYGGYLVMHDRIPLGAGLVVFAGLLQQFSGQVANIAGIANSVQESLSAARRVFEVLDAPVDIESPADPAPLAQARGAVRFEQVSFAYVPGEEVLTGIDFAVDPGQTVAILGTTGSGKSTLMSLIARFYDVNRGRICIDGIDVRDLDLEALRRCVGIVFQENFLFSSTVAENIAFGHPDASRDQVKRAAQIARAHRFIMELPHGYDTVLGEEGGDLSGGQRQRLAIARAVLLEPPILLLDDPTAAIDPETEAAIMESMRSAAHGRTTFVVAHRLSTLRRADLVIVLRQGEIVQQGTHEALMQEPGPYRRVARLQVIDDESRSLLAQTEGGV